MNEVAQISRLVEDKAKCVEYGEVDLKLIIRSGNIQRYVISVSESRYIDGELMKPLVGDGGK